MPNLFAPDAADNRPTSATRLSPRRMGRQGSAPASRCGHVHVASSATQEDGPPREQPLCGALCAHRHEGSRADRATVPILARTFAVIQRPRRPASGSRTGPRRAARPPSARSPPGGREEDLELGFRLGPLGLACLQDPLVWPSSSSALRLDVVGISSRSLLAVAFSWRSPVRCWSAALAMSHSAAARFSTTSWSAIDAQLSDLQLGRGG